MREIGVSVSKKQLSRLKNGHSVRVKEGEGILIVNPNRYDLMSKTFAKGKSPTISLTPEEILLNTRGYQPETHQTNAGYIPKKEDSSRVATPKSSSYVGTKTGQDLNAEGLKELNRKYREDVAKNVEWSEAERKKHKMKLIVSLLKQAKYRQEYPENVVSTTSREPVLRPPPIPESFLKEVALSTKPSEPAPVARPAPERQVSALFNAYATQPPVSAETRRRQQAFAELPQGAGISKFVSNAGGTRTKSGNYAGNYLLEAGLANASAGQVQDHFIQGGIQRARKHQMVVGMGIGYGFHKRHTEGVGAGGNILRRGNPALQSQPFSANFSQASQLPPSFQRFHTSV